MAKLTDDQKAFIVRQLAAFRTPQQVASDVQAEFGLTISREQARNYDPRVRHKKPVAQRWVDLFKLEHATYVKATSHIAYAHRTHRLRTLGLLIDLELARQCPNARLVAQLMKQASKECSDATTEASLGGPYSIAPSTSPFQPCERRKRISGLLTKAVTLNGR